MAKPLRKTTRKPLWNGPEEDGITFSLLSKFLVCRERFRLKVVEGIEEDEGFSPALEFGNLWHEAEEAHSGKRDWRQALSRYYAKLRERYPADETETRKWYEVAKVTFPLYVNHWRNSPEEMNRKPILEEAAFRVPYRLPSGRTVTLRGKFDCVFRNGSTIYLQENKTKGKIDVEGIQKTVSQNLQTMLYQIALRRLCQELPVRSLSDYLDKDHTPLVIAYKRNPTIGGVLYNVVRRPLADQRAIKQRKGRMVKGKRVGAESAQAFYKRLAGEIKKAPSEYFLRWNVAITERDIEAFKVRVFHPILEQLVDWWDHISTDPFNPWPSVNRLHYVSPWGVYNSLGSGFRGDYFDLLTTGQTSGLRKIESLFPELT